MRKKEITVVIKDENGDLLFTYSEPIEISRGAMENRTWIKKGIWNIKELLNTQPQTEEWYCECGEPANQGEHICKDTPEEKEGWEEDFRGFLDFVIEDDSNKKEVVEYVKNLLSEREREVLEMIYRKQDCFLHLGDFERWLEREYPELEDIDLSDSESYLN